MLFSLTFPEMNTIKIDWPFLQVWRWSNASGQLGRSRLDKWMCRTSGAPLCLQPPPAQSLNGVPRWQKHHSECASVDMQNKHHTASARNIPLCQITNAAVLRSITKLLWFLFISLKCDYTFTLRWPAVRSNLQSSSLFFPSLFYVSHLPGALGNTKPPEERLTAKPQPEEKPAFDWLMTSVTNCLGADRG